MRQICLVLFLKENEGMTQNVLGEHLGMPEGTMSKNIKMLSTFGERDKNGTMQLKGHGLVETRSDVYDRKRNAVFLTPKGKRLLEGIDMIFEGKNGEVILVETKTQN